MTSLCCSISASNWVSFNLRTCSSKNHAEQHFGVVTKRMIMTTMRMIFHLVGRVAPIPDLTALTHRLGDQLAQRVLAKNRFLLLCAPVVLSSIRCS